MNKRFNNLNNTVFGVYIGLVVGLVIINLLRFVSNYYIILALIIGLTLIYLGIWLFLRNYAKRSSDSYQDFYAKQTYPNKMVRADMADNLGKNSKKMLNLLLEALKTCNNATQFNLTTKRNYIQLISACISEILAKKQNEESLPLIESVASQQEIGTFLRTFSNREILLDSIKTRTISGSPTELNLHRLNGLKSALETLSKN